jgi:site-specific DNA recombinase
MKALGYIRVSTADQSTSLEVQTQKIQDYCKFRGIELIHIYTDENVSGGKPFYQRAGGAEANNMLINTDVKTIICIKPDRLFRSVKDALITVDDWAENGIALHIVDLG